MGKERGGNGLDEGMFESSYIYSLERVDKGKDVLLFRMMFHLLIPCGGMMQ